MTDHTDVPEAQTLLIEAISRGRVSHTRAGSGLYRGAVLVYEHNHESPTGVSLLCVVDDSTEVAAILRGGLAPLSPTETR